MQDCCPNANLLVDYNLFWSSSGSPSASLIGKTGAHDKKADPLFVNPSVDPAVADFHLKAGSPAIDAGTTVGAPAIDFDGNPRPAGAGIDIGAYEYGAGSAVRPAHADRAAAPAAIAVIPNLRTGSVHIRLASPGDIAVFTINGSRVASFKNVASADWKATAAVRGVYLVEAIINGTCVGAKVPMLQ
jgi:hypothetical protein